MGGLGTSIRPPLQNAVAKITLIFAGMLGGYAILRAYGLSLSQNLYVLSPPQTSSVTSESFNEPSHETSPNFDLLAST